MTTTLEAVGVRSQIDDAEVTVPARDLLAMLKKVRVPGLPPAPHVRLTALSFQDSGWFSVETFDYQTGLCVSRGTRTDETVHQRLIQGEVVIHALTEIARGAAKDLDVTLKWAWDKAERISRLSLEADGFVISVPSSLASSAHEDYFTSFLPDSKKEPVAHQGSVTVDVQAFRGVIDQVSHCVSKDGTLPILTAIVVEFSSDRVMAYATDRYRMARSWFPTRCDFRGKFLIRLTEWKRIRVLLDRPGDMQLNLSGRYSSGSSVKLQASSDHFEVSLLGLNGEYPKILNMFRPEGEQHLVFSAAQMLRAARVLESILERNLPLVLNSADNGSALQITGSMGSEDADAAKSPLIPAEGDLEVRTAFNPLFYREALRAIRGDKIRFSSYDPVKPVRLTSAAEPLDQVTLEQLVMPVRPPRPDRKS